MLCFLILTPRCIGSAFCQQECTTINIADDPEGPPRLVRSFVLPARFLDVAFTPD